MSNLDHFQSIKAFVFDVDGVLTNGQVILLPDGQQMRHMHSKDGYALQLAVKKGYHVGIITGGNSVQVKERLQGLGITDVYMRVSHKDEAMEDFKFSYDLQDDQVMYMGDDIPDLAAMSMVGLPACPADASPEVKKVSQFVSHMNGGAGCVREIIELIMRSHGNWYDARKNPGNFAEFTW